MQAQTLAGPGTRQGKVGDRKEARPGVLALLLESSLPDTVLGPVCWERGRYGYSTRAGYSMWRKKRWTGQSISESRVRQDSLGKGRGRVVRLFLRQYDN
jgi:hypothetical protein